MSEHDKQIVIECPHCAIKVAGSVLVERHCNPTDPDDNYDPFILYFLECPSCLNPMLGCSDLIRITLDKWDYDKPYRLWPEPTQTLHWSIPLSVRQSIEEAQNCFKGQAYAACAAMCGRVLETICQERGVKEEEDKLYRALKKLRCKDIIDGRLFEWGTMLREQRNIGAHASDEDISKEDANDLLDFTIAICDYIYVLTHKYERFKKRKAVQKIQEV